MYSLMHRLAPVTVSSNGLFCAIVLLFLMLLFVIMSIAACKWRMNKKLGFTMFMLYFVFLVLSVMLEDRIIVCPVSIWAIPWLLDSWMAIHKKEVVGEILERIHYNFFNKHRSGITFWPPCKYCVWTLLLPSNCDPRCILTHFYHTQRTIWQLASLGLSYEPWAPMILLQVYHCSYFLDHF